MFKSTLQLWANMNKFHLSLYSTVLCNNAIIYSTINHKFYFYYVCLSVCLSIILTILFSSGIQVNTGRCGWCTSQCLVDPPISCLQPQANSWSSLTLFSLTSLYVSNSLCRICVLLTPLWACVKHTWLVCQMWMRATAFLLLGFGLTFLCGRWNVTGAA